VSDEVEQIEPDDDGINEEWVRWTDYPELRGINVCRVDEIGCWLVGIGAQEFYRWHQPLGAELRQRVQGALLAVGGVTGVDEHDNETWDVTGTPSGEALTRAAARVVDDMFDRLQPGGTAQEPEAVVAAGWRGRALVSAICNSWHRGRARLGTRRS
jgi:hypothetical protein